MPIDAKWSPGQKEAFVAEWVAAGKPTFKAFAAGRDFSEKSLREWATAQGAYTPVPQKGRKPKPKPKEQSPASAPENVPEKEEIETVTGQQAIQAIVDETSTATVPMQAPATKTQAPPPPAVELSEASEPKPARPGVPSMVWYIVGGVVVLGAIVLIVRTMNAQKTTPPRVENPNRERRPYDEIRNQFGIDPGDIPVPGA